MTDADVRRKNHDIAKAQLDQIFEQNRYFCGYGSHNGDIHDKEKAHKFALELKDTVVIVHRAAQSCDDQETITDIIVQFFNVEMFAQSIGDGARGEKWQCECDGRMRNVYDFLAEQGKEAFLACRGLVPVSVLVDEGVM